MLDDYIEIQQQAYQILKNTIKKNKCSHAYIIETNGTSDAMAFSLAFAKYLFCPYNYTNNKECKKCTQCMKINDGNFLELKIINPDGSWIKKGSLEELQEEFNMKSMIGNKKIYIINEADRLNISSANSILKFLEEPVPGITAILIVDNIYKLLPTIISRCQIISLKNSNKSLISKKDISKEELDDILSKVFDFVYYFENNKLYTITMTNNLWLKNFKEKEKCNFALEIMLELYRIILDYKLDIKNENFIQNKEEIIKISNMNTKEALCKKIKLIFNAKQKLKNNANVSMLMDKLVIELERT